MKNRRAFLTEARDRRSRPHPLHRERTAAARERVIEITWPDATITKRFLISSARESLFRTHPVHALLRRAMKSRRINARDVSPGLVEPGVNNGESPAICVSRKEHDLAICDGDSHRDEMGDRERLVALFRARMKPPFGIVKK